MLYRDPYLQTSFLTSHRNTATFFVGLHIKYYSCHIRLVLPKRFLGFVRRNVSLQEQVTASNLYVTEQTGQCLAEVRGSRGTTAAEDCSSNSPVMVDWCIGVVGEKSAGCMKVQKQCGPHTLAANVRLCSRLLTDHWVTDLPSAGTVWRWQRNSSQVSSYRLGGPASMPDRGTAKCSLRRHVWNGSWIQSSL